MLYGRVNTAALNVRLGPGPSYIDIGDLLQNDYVIASESMGGWYHLQDARRNSWTGEPVKLSNGVTIAERAKTTNDVWCSGAYILTVDPPPTLPPAPPDALIADIQIKAYQDGTFNVQINGAQYIKI